MMKYCLSQGAQTIQCVSVRIMLEIAKVKGFRLWAVDVNFAYLQSGQPLIRKILINNLAPEFELSPKEVFQLLKPIYGLADSDDLLQRVLDYHV